MNEGKNYIFLVDDNIVNLNTGKAALHHKYNVVTIPSGEKLLLALNRIKPDLILLDTEMPGMSGYDLIKEIKANPENADIPVIFLTGKNESEDESLGFSLGAVDYITKPLSSTILLRRVEFHLALQSQKHNLREFEGKLLEMSKERTNGVSGLENGIIMWAAEVIESRDEETGRHERVQKYLKLLLNEMKKSEYFADTVATWDIDAFLKSAILHDIGKIKIRDDILLKKTGLTDEEFKDIKLHSLYGKTLIEGLQDKMPDQTFIEYAKVHALSHHERWDGTGYPDNLKGEKIPLQARMMAIVDVYDALTSKRPYREAISHEEAIRIISDERGAQFDPNLSDLFIGLSNKIRTIGEVMNNGEA